MRPNNRENNQPRSIKITRNYTKHAEGSVLVEFGDTRVLCTATVEDTVPRFLKGQGQGWVTAEYGMLPRSTHSRMQREAAKGKQGGIVNGEAVCDLEYEEDSVAETDMNVVMMEDGRMIEVQGTAEGEPFSHEELLTLLDLAKQGCKQIFAAQREALGL